ncbi:MAG: CRTAC1 family protein [Verrucomicrobiales bacterium]
MLFRAFLFACAVFAYGAAGCRKSVEPVAHGPHGGQLWFEDATGKLGVQFVHDPGTTGRFFFPESVGSGGAVFDYDNDGRLDIYLVQNGGPDSLSKNQLFHQKADGAFENVSAGSGLDIAGYGMGVACGDYDNDGLPDVLVTEYNRVRLFCNAGRGKFIDVTKGAEVENPAWAVSAAFFDYDRDGWLDLVVANYVENNETQRCYDRSGQLDYCGPSGFLDRVTTLFHNRGRDPAGRVRFEDVTVKSGLGAEPGPGLGVTCADFDDDKWPDILVANDGKPNALWMNQHDGTFKNEAVVRGVAYNNMGRAQANMGIAIAETTGRGQFDIFITHLIEESHVLWKQDPPGAFLDQTGAAGLTGSRWHGTGFGTAFADFDNDGAPDLAVVNGGVRHPRVDDGRPKLVPALGPHWSRYVERNQLFANDGTGKFRDVSAANPAFCEEYQVGRGLACGDIDNDGGVDLLVTAIAGPAKIFRNIAPRAANWLSIRAIDPMLGGRDAYGAKITVVAGARRRVAWVNPAFSYASSSDPRAHFGLGAATHADTIHVLWPGGEEEGFPGAHGRQLLVLKKGTGQPAAGVPSAAP